MIIKDDHLLLEVHLFQKSPHMLQPDRSRFECDECGADFSTKSNLVQHKKCTLGHILLTPDVDGANAFQFCDGCSKGFTTKSNLTRHQRKCVPQRFVGFPCSECSKIFSSQAALQSHQRQAHRLPELTARTLVDIATTVPVFTGIFPKYLAHSVCVFVPSRGDNSLGHKDQDFGASQIERNCFGAVLLALSAFRGIGDAGAVTVVYPQSISAAEFWQASSEMGCSDVWDLIVSAGCISTFTDMKSLKSAFTSTATRMIAYQQSNGSLEPLSSVFLFGHGDSERVKVGFGEKFDTNGKTLKRPAMLSVSDVSELLDTCHTDVAHIMTCKASRFTRNLLDKTKALSGRNDRVLFLAYGAEDITTVPLVFAPGTHQCVSLLQ